MEFAKDGDEAIEIYKKEMESGEPFDATILDLTVKGGMGGVRAIKKLLEIDPETKAIISTGYTSDPILTNYGPYGFRGAITKPFTTDELYRAVDAVMEGQES